MQTLKIGDREITSGLVGLKGIRTENYCGVKTYFATVQTHKNFINPDTGILENIIEEEEIQINSKEFHKYKKELFK